jgi:glycosyltransferase involved in cell wall biosynthesis
MKISMISTARPMRVMLLGLRGFPEVQGGVETHAEHLCPRLVKLGCEVTVLARAPYQPKEVGNEWNGVKFVSLWAPKSKGLEAILHSLIGVLYAAIKRPDVLHIQAIGPSIMTLLARLLGLRVVVTHHGPDYDREKWGHFARSVLKLGERFGMCLSNRRIVISKVIADIVRDKYGLESDLIPNGVVLPEMQQGIGTLVEHDLISGKYVLLVGRLVEEKRHQDLIEAFNRAAIPEWKLVIVGASDHPDAYTRKVINLAEQSPNAVMTGYLKGLPLHQLYSHAGVFVLPSSHEGLPIALLEALSYGLPVLASYIPANVELGLAASSYFNVGNIDELASKLLDVTKMPYSVNERESRRNLVAYKYNWDKIASDTLSVYAKSIYKDTSAIATDLVKS